MNITVNLRSLSHRGYLRIPPDGPPPEATRVPRGFFGIKIAPSKTVLIAMSASKPTLSIHAAVMSCVVRCAESETPLVSLGDFLENLARIGWHTDDVEAVQGAVLPMLAELQTGEAADTEYATLTAGQAASLA